MRFAPITDRLADLGSAKWEIHSLGRKMKAAGEAVIELTIGEPDVATPPALLDAASAIAELPSDLPARASRPPAPLNTICSYRWATPFSGAGSWREPTSA